MAKTVCRAHGADYPLLVYGQADGEGNISLRKEGTDYRIATFCSNIHLTWCYLLVGYRFALQYQSIFNTNMVSLTYTLKYEISQPINYRNLNNEVAQINLSSPFSSARHRTGQHVVQVLPPAAPDLLGKARLHGTGLHSSPHQVGAEQDPPMEGGRDIQQEEERGVGWGGAGRLCRHHGGVVNVCD